MDCNVQCSNLWYYHSLGSKSSYLTFFHMELASAPPRFILPCYRFLFYFRTHFNGFLSSLLTFRLYFYIMVDNCCFGGHLRDDTWIGGLVSGPYLMGFPLGILRFPYRAPSGAPVALLRICAMPGLTRAPDGRCGFTGPCCICCMLNPLIIIINYSS